MNNIILLNGPPRCGKDVLANSRVGYVNVKFATAVKDGTHKLYELDVETDAYEATKDEESKDFGGYTPRQAYISYSEGRVKPLVGEDYFGRTLAIDCLVDDSLKNLIVSDCGFEPEVNIFVKVIRTVYPDCKLLLLRIHRDGCDFENDSRSYIEIPEVKTLDIYNNVSERNFIKEANLVINEELR